MIEVTCAIILWGSKFLTVQRGPESNHPWKWEFPGGKIKPEETAVACVIREIKEELDVQVEVVSQLDYIDYSYDTKQIRLIPFVCKIVSGEIVLTEHVGKLWFVLDEWEMIDWLEADREIILKNQKKLKDIILENHQ